MKNYPQIKITEYNKSLKYEGNFQEISLALMRYLFLVSSAYILYDT